MDWICKIIISNQSSQRIVNNGVTGYCPRVKCDKQPVLPVGTSDDLRVSRVKTFCPKCEQIYATKTKYCDIDEKSYSLIDSDFNQRSILELPSSRLHSNSLGLLKTYFIKRMWGGNIHDGAYFGTSFAHIFLLQFPMLVPILPPEPFTPRLYGFKIHGKQQSVIQRFLDENERKLQEAEEGKRVEHFLEWHPIHTHFHIKINSVVRNVDIE